MFLTISCKLPFYLLFWNLNWSLLIAPPIMSAVHHTDLIVNLLICCSLESCFSPPTASQHFLETLYIQHCTKINLLIYTIHIQFLWIQRIFTCPSYVRQDDGEREEYKKGIEMHYVHIPTPHKECNYITYCRYVYYKNKHTKNKICLLIRV